ncbi:MAG: hypothetical protein SFX19_05205 [Alphaproteobacteria bacterium]|nr:hypothetical protein [Alphaproteobacteria bacterium]
MRKLPFLFALCTLLASCLDAGTVSPGPAPNFGRYQPIYMSVARIDVLEEYKSPMRPPNAEHLMPYSPADAMQIWIKQRLKASGGGKTMQIIIKDASVIEKPLPTTEGVMGMFSTEPDREYRARLEVEMRIYGDAALSEASISVVATRSLQMREDETLTTRDQKFRGMMTEMMTTMNAEMEKNIFQYLGPYVNFSINP